MMSRKIRILCTFFGVVPLLKRWRRNARSRRRARGRGREGVRGRESHRQCTSSTSIPVSRRNGRLCFPNRGDFSSFKRWRNARKGSFGRGGGGGGSVSQRRFRLSFEKWVFLSFLSSFHCENSQIFMLCLAFFYQSTLFVDLWRSMFTSTRIVTLVIWLLPTRPSPFFWYVGKKIKKRSLSVLIINFFFDFDHDWSFFFLFFPILSLVAPFMIMATVVFRFFLRLKILRPSRLRSCFLKGVVPRHRGISFDSEWNGDIFVVIFFSSRLISDLCRWQASEFFILPRHQCRRSHFSDGWFTFLSHSLVDRFSINNFNFQILFLIILLPTSHLPAPSLSICTLLRTLNVGMRLLLFCNPLFPTRDWLFLRHLKVRGRSWGRWERCKMFASIGECARGPLWGVVFFFIRFQTHKPIFQTVDHYLREDCLAKVVCKVCGLIIFLVVFCQILNFRWIT